MMPDTSTALSREDHEYGSAPFIADPYPIYRRWRSEAPVWWSKKMNGWMISRYADVRSVLARHRTWKQSLYFEGALVDAFDGMTMIAMNEPEHGEIRRRAEPFFRPTGLEERMKEAVEEIVADLLDGLRPGESFEFSTRITGPLVLRVMAALMGTDDSAHLAELYRRVLEYQRGIRSRTPDQEAGKSGMRAGRELISYLGELAAVRGRSPLYDALTDAGIDRKLALSACALTLAGGVETTTRGLASTSYALVSHQDQLQLVRNDPALAQKAFEEGLRWVSPVQLKARQAAEDIELGGEVIRAGDIAFPLLGAANRDERHYPDPDRYDLGRHSADHLAFGSGIHYCLGAPLAKLEARTVIQKLLDRFGSLEFAPGYVVRWDGPIHRSPSEVVLVGR
jgi:cytochrome P450